MADIGNQEHERSERSACDENVLRWYVLAGVIVLAMVLFGCIGGLWLGDWCTWGYFVGLIAVLALFAWGGSKRFSDALRSYPDGLSTVQPGLRRYRKVSLYLSLALIFLATASAVINHIASGKRGVVESLPVLDTRKEYLLNSHGILTPVSRTTYVVVGTTFLLGLFLLCAAFCIIVIHRGMFGEWIPDVFNKGRPKRGKEDDTSAQLDR